MSASKEAALEQVLRFENYANFPGEEREADQEELTRAFIDVARDDAHAAEIGDWLIRHRPVPECRFCPLPAEVYDAAEKIASAKLPKPSLQPARFAGLGWSCDKCHDVGFISAQIDGIDMATPCECRKLKASTETQPLLAGAKGM